MTFTPQTFQQLAGVTAYYNMRNWHFGYVTVDDAGDTVFEVLSCDAGRLVEHPGVRVPVPSGAPVGLAVELDGPRVRFGHGLGDGWRTPRVELDATILSDEYAQVGNVPGEEDEYWGFTGAFLGLWVQDIGADGGYADFADIRYHTG